MILRPNTAVTAAFRDLAPGVCLLLVSLTSGRIMAGTTSSSVTTSTPSQVDHINRLVRSQWKEYGLEPSSLAKDRLWCRRLYLDVIGRIPTVSELNAFLGYGRERRQRLVGELLHGSKYASAYARYWSIVWTNLLIGRSGGSEPASLTDREGMQVYLRDAISQSKRYDQLVFDLITACGSNAPDSEEFNGAVNFLVGKLGDKATQATSQSARLFLGLRVQCTQCHNHPFNNRRQSQFWELNAFFRQAAALRRFDKQNGMIRNVELTNQDFPGESATPAEADVFYESRTGTLAAAYPVFVDGTALQNKSGYLDEVNRRQELGRLMIQSPYLPRAIVNRLWGHFLGYGFTTPVDDMGPHNVPANPELLDYLANQLTLHEFDLKKLIEWIALSQPYSLSSQKTAKNEADTPSRGKPPRFSRFYLRQMRAEELYESLLVAAGLGREGRSDPKLEQEKRDWLRQITIAFGTDEGDETTTFDGTITQTLMLFNGDLVRRALSDKPGGYLFEVARSKRQFDKKIDHLFLTALARVATTKEQRMAKMLRAARQGDEMAALQDVWWAVLNSNEFILNH